MIEPMPRPTEAIRTPDQRLRIFVSSTLGELADERRAVRAAVERLHLAPVMFELGARPHAPRNLYRAYLDQSDVFVGIYWEKYGWVAPGEEISGLEDEYRLSSALPRLIYIKNPAPDREPRLGELLTSIRTQDSASYKAFSTADELADLLETDLATLLAERFDQSRIAATTTGPIAVAPSAEPTLATLPAPLTSLIGRAVELGTLRDLLGRDDVRLVTLTGSGGIGKSRLAIDVAGQLGEEFTGGVAFVDLTSVRDPAEVPSAIAQAIGVRDTGDGPITDKLVTALRHRRVLLVLDNFEQVLDAASALTSLLAEAPGLTLLVTSRTLLRVTGEHAFDVGPLGLPAAEENGHLDESAAVRLFVERARAVRPDFEITPDNARAIRRLCIALDGVPLAIELAAARVRMMPPAAMLERIDRQLPILVGGARDLPQRQQTLRSTIEWSTELLSDDELHLLAALGVFAGSFSLEAVESIVSADGKGSPLDALGVLVDSSLVRQHDRGDLAYFSMLQTVREYAREKLVENGFFEVARARHADYYVQLGERLETVLEGAEQREWVANLSDEHENLRAAARFLLEVRDWERAASFAWTLYVYWWVGGHLGEVPVWMDEVLNSADAASGALTPRTRAIALYFTRAIRFWHDPEEWVIPGLTESAELFRDSDDQPGEALARISLALARLSCSTPNPEAADDELETSVALFRQANDRWGEALALVTLGRVALLQQHLPRALNRFDESLTLAREQGDALGTNIALHHLGWAHLLLGELDLARAKFEECLANSARLGHDEGVAYGLEGLVAIAASAGEYHRAGELFGASQSLREQAGINNAPTFSFHQQYIDRIEKTEFAEEFEASRIRGRVMSADAATAVALTAVES